MTSEELAQRYPSGRGQKLGNYEVFECQTVTINQFAENGILPNVDYGVYKTEKCDALIISRIPDVHAVAIGEHKRPGELTDTNWRGIAADLLEKKCRTAKAKIGYVTDSIRTFWINGHADKVMEVEREDGQTLPHHIDFKDRAFVSELNYVLAYFDPVTNRVKAKTEANPDHLAKEVWQTIWRWRADDPEDCLATFVELFTFKFLDDLGLLVRNQTGADVSLSYVMQLPKETSYKYYWDTVRPYIKWLFPPGKDGYSIINGIVLQPHNRDHNVIFHEIMRKFVKFGSLKNTESDFKRRLFESFLKESKTTSTFGQHLTPRKIVTAIHDMAEVDQLSHGKTICDPASGVGGFVLEQMARDLASQWTLKGNKMIPVHDWLAWEILPKTSILARANALVHCGDCLADQPERVKSFAKWLNRVFFCFDKTALGSLEAMIAGKFDLILTNPPFVVSGSKDFGKLIKKNNKRRRYFCQKSSGAEGLFVQFIVNALKPNSDAWVLLPEAFFLRTTDKSLRSWMLQNCVIDFLAILPERTFYNTPKRVVIAHLKRRPHELDDKTLRKQLRKESTLLFAVSEIGETRDAKRLPCNTDLPEMVTAFKLHQASAEQSTGSKRAVAVGSLKLYEQRSMNLRHFWDKQTAIELGLLGSEANPEEKRSQLGLRVNALRTIVDDWQNDMAGRAVPKRPDMWKTVKLGDVTLFTLRIGRRVLKKEIYQNKTDIPLFSANIRKPFGYVHAPNAGKLPKGGALWSIDSDFDCRGVSPGEVYSITDHCGQIEILDESIDPPYLAMQVRQAGLDVGFNREYRPSLNVMRDLEIDLPVTDAGNFDLGLMREWSGFLAEIERKRDEIERLLKSN
jgi:type I restriction enzyme M protein